MRDSVKAVPLLGASSVSLMVGARSPGYTRYLAVAPVEDRSC